MAHRNRVDPYGEIIATELRGSWLGNRGCIHLGRDIARPWNGRRWITCALEFKGWVAPKWVPGRWTALFFYDEAVALSAGHRPCALCRRADYRRYCEAIGIFRADEIDARLHNERLNGKRKRSWRTPWRELPAGAFVDITGIPLVVLDDGLRPWSSTNGYGATIARPTVGAAEVLTPPLSLHAISNGYAPQIS